MRKISKAVLFATLYILVFVAIPNIVLRYVPKEGLVVAAMLGISVEYWLTTFSWIGLALAALSFIKNMTESWTYPNFLAQLISALLEFYLSLFMFGLGDSLGFGVTRRSIQMDPLGREVSVMLFLDFGFVIALLALAKGLSIVKGVINLYTSRKEHFAKLG